MGLGLKQGHLSWLGEPTKMPPGCLIGEMFFWQNQPRGDPEADLKMLARLHLYQSYLHRRESFLLALRHPGQLKVGGCRD